MGVHLVRILADAGHDVYVTTRKKRSNTRNIIYLSGNAHSGEFLDQLLKSHWDAVVDFMVYSTAEFQNRIKQLLNAAEQYIYLSSSRVYADSVVPITEESPRLLDVCHDPVYLATDEYALSKARQEDLLKNSGQSNWTVIRPYITYSETRLQLGGLEIGSWLFRALHGRTIVFSRDLLSCTTTLTYGKDVSRGIAGIIGKEDALGQFFHITSEESSTWGNILGIYLRCLEEYSGKRPRVYLTDKSLNLKYGKYQILYDRCFNRRFDNSKIGHFIDVSSFKSPEEGLAECLKSFLKNPVFPAVGSRWEAEFNRLTHERISFLEFPSLQQYLKYVICRYFLIYLQRKEDM